MNQKKQKYLNNSSNTFSYFKSPDSINIFSNSPSSSYQNNLINYSYDYNMNFNQLSSNFDYFYLNQNKFFSLNYLNNINSIIKIDLKSKKKYIKNLDSPKKIII
jgi:hypothetical protein